MLAASHKSEPLHGCRSDLPLPTPHLLHSISSAASIHAHVAARAVATTARMPVCHKTVCGVLVILATSFIHPSAGLASHSISTTLTATSITSAASGLQPGDLLEKCESKGKKYHLPNRSALIVTTSHGVLGPSGCTTCKPTGICSPEMTVPCVAHAILQSHMLTSFPPSPWATAGIRCVTTSPRVVTTASTHCTPSRSPLRSGCPIDTLSSSLLPTPPFLACAHLCAAQNSQSQRIAA